jgi:hypothetical protein
MKTLTVLLPEPVGRLVERDAATRRVDPAALCASILAEHFLSLQVRHRETVPLPETKGEEHVSFNVGEHFKASIPSILPKRSWTRR